MILSIDHNGQTSLLLPFSIKEQLYSQCLSSSNLQPSQDHSGVWFSVSHPSILANS